MRSRQPPRTAVQTHIVGVGLLAFGAAGLPIGMLGGPSQAASLGIALAQAGAFAGCLGAALISGSTSRATSRAGQRAARWAALFALAAACALLFLRPASSRLMADLWLLALLAGACAFAGAATGAVVHGNGLLCGHIVGAYIIGATVAGIVLQADGISAQAVVPIVGAAGALGALLLTCGSMDGLSRGVAGIALAACLAVPVLERLNFPVPGFAPTGSRWLIPGDAAAGLQGFLTWCCALLAVAAPGAFTAALPAEQRHGLLRLHVVVLLWVAASTLLLWHPMHKPAAALSALVPGPLVLWLAVGALTGGVIADSWPVGRTGLTRAFVGGMGALLAAAALGLERPTSPVAAGGMGLAAAAMAFAAGLLFGFMIPTAARTALLRDPIDPVWLLSAGGLASVAMLAYFSQAQHLLPSARLLPWAGVLLAALCFATVSEMRFAREWLLLPLQWLAREWGAPPTVEAQIVPRRERALYPLWLRALKALVYLGYLPWWVAVGALRALWSVVSALALLGAGALSGVFDAILELVFGKEPVISARRVAIAGTAPLVSLSPEEEMKSSEEMRQEQAAQRKQGTLSRLLSLPMAAFAVVLERGGSLFERIAKRLRRPKPQEPEAAQNAVTETVVLRPAPVIAPPEVPTLETIREQALRRRSADSRWRRLLRATVGKVAGLRVREWLGRDDAEPWDDRVFRAELMGPYGAHFELVGHLWASRRRRGCVVIVITPSRPVDKGIEVSATQRDVRSLLQNNPDQLKKILLRAAYRAAVVDVRAGVMASGVTTCDSPREDLIELHQDRYCELREEQPSIGFRCRHSLAQDQTHGGTSLPACSGCNFPEVWERCSNLKLEGTIGTVDEDGVLRRRAHMLCTVTQGIVDPGECLGRECFSPCVITRVIALDHDRTR